MRNILLYCVPKELRQCEIFSCFVFLRNYTNLQVKLLDTLEKQSKQIQKQQEQLAKLQKMMMRKMLIKTMLLPLQPDRSLQKKLSK